MKEFNKVIGYESIKKELYRILDMMNNHDKYAALGVKTPRGLLFNGKPGLGKTLMAKCFIKASKRKTFTIRKDKPNEDFIKYIKSTFEKAKKEAPCIVFLDDLDKFANEDEEHKNCEVFVTIQSCIDDLEDTEVFVLATANSIKNIPDSLLREGRLNKKIEFDYPEDKDVKDIVKYYLSKKKVSKDLNYEDIARLLCGKSCACLEMVINEAGVYAAFEGKKEIEMNDIVRSFLRVQYNDSENVNCKNKYIRNIAVHEAGHAVVGEVLCPNSLNLVHINPSNYSYMRGFANYNQGDDYFLDIKNMENRVITLLAGKAATELVYGKVDTGTMKDIDRAYSIVKRIVTRYCARGFYNYETHECEITDDNEKQLIANELDRYYLMAKQIIIENRKFFDAIVDKLVKDKVVLYSEMQELKAKYVS